MHEKGVGQHLEFGTDQLLTRSLLPKGKEAGIPVAPPPPPPSQNHLPTPLRTVAALKQHLVLRSPNFVNVSIKVFMFFLCSRDILSVNYQLQLLKAMNLVETDHELHKQVNVSFF